jgi:hypothetical protein
MKCAIFWDVTLCNLVEFRTLLAACFSLHAHLSNFSTRKLEAVFSSESSVNFYHTTRSHISEDSIRTLVLFLFIIVYIVFITYII